MPNNKNKTPVLKWGSPKWRNHLVRSLAQRKRHGENIRDVKGLAAWIESNNKPQ